MSIAKYEATTGDKCKLTWDAWPAGGFVVGQDYTAKITTDESAGLGYVWQVVSSTTTNGSPVNTAAAMANSGTDSSAKKTSATITWKAVKDTSVTVYAICGATGGKMYVADPLNRCSAGFYGGSAGCVACGTGAATCTSATVALTCAPKFFITNAKACTACGTGAATCTSAAVALTCSAGFYKTDAKECKACGTGAATCTSATVALTCSDGFYFADKKCTTCAKITGAKADATYTCTSKTTSRVSACAAATSKKTAGGTGTADTCTSSMPVCDPLGAAAEKAKCTCGVSEYETCNVGAFCYGRICLSTKYPCTKDERWFGPGADDPTIVNVEKRNKYAKTDSKGVCYTPCTEEELDAANGQCALHDCVHCRVAAGCYQTQVRIK